MQNMQVTGKCNTRQGGTRRCVRTKLSSVSVFQSASQQFSKNGQVRQPATPRCQEDTSLGSKHVTRRP